MDGASFWSALTKPSVFSYAAKALILISLFPSGLNLWSETPGLLGVEVLKCMCAILFSIQGQNSLLLVSAYIAKMPANWFFFAFHAELLVFLATAAIFPACPAQVYRGCCSSNTGNKERRQSSSERRAKRK